MPGYRPVNFGARAFEQRRGALFQVVGVFERAAPMAARC
jgi:hypothetical protein